MKPEENVLHEVQRVKDELSAEADYDPRKLGALIRKRAREREAHAARGRQSVESPAGELDFDSADARSKGSKRHGR